ncbi:MAG: CDP-alcohol phosphatidyltransferase family protein [Alphaproteobacteria bacterium]|nr:CDP-alcohol phosphatidyltransferase family protein [Alphaproteobacteria bacterium]
MKIFVNSLTAFRMIAALALIPCLIYQWFWLMFILFALAGITDFFDGWLAKKYKVTTKLGGVMDHIADKLLVTIGSLLIGVFLQLWIVLLPVILMIARNLYISGLREFLGTQKIEMPVPSPRMSWGKVAAFAQMTSVGALMLAINILPLVPANQFLYYFLMASIAGLWISLAASLISAAQYTVSFLRKIKKLK